MLKAKKVRKEEFRKAEKKLTSEFKTFSYRAVNVDEFERKIIHRLPIKFEAKKDKDGLIIIKAIAPDGGIVSVEETYDYAWFNANFYREYHNL